MRISNLLWRYNFSMNKGRFIVLEGLDRSGKSTIAKQLHKKYSTVDNNVMTIGFPNRNSPTGVMINDYLSNKSDICHEAIHLLFSANRWEAKKGIQENLKNGFDVVCDRYWYSGVVYSYAKGLDIQWCMEADKGLTEPDLVIYLKGDPTNLAKRAGYGNQRFEKIQFQQKVSQGFDKLIRAMDKPYVKIIQIDNKSLQQVKSEVFTLVNSYFETKTK